MSLSDVYAVPGLHPFYMKTLQERFTLHIDSLSKDPARLATLAPRTVELAALRESRVPGSLMAQMPELQAASNA